MRILIGFILVVLSTLFAEIKPPVNFIQAKDLARNNVYYDLKEELYCDCPFEWQGRKGVVDIEACGYKIRKNEVRARRVEWEHIVPISIISKQMQCWINGGRKNCQKISNASNTAEADIYNLLPVIGEINGDRAGFSFYPVEKHPP